MKILLVRVKPSPKSINLQSFMICEPLELEYAAAVLKRDGHDVELIDMLVEKQPFSRLLNKQYGMVCFTAYINLVGVVKDYAAIVKRMIPSAVTVVGGVHAEVIPEDFIDANIDHIMCANGLRTICEIVGGVKKPDGSYAKDKPKPEIISTPDDIYPDREITSKYRSKYHYIYHERCANLKTSYGCPYKCKFCFCTQICKYSVRELDDVINELKQIKEDNIFIVDDDFLFSRERLVEFCRMLDENNINKHYIAFGRADFVVDNEDIIMMLHAHGFEAFFIGIESFKKDELADMNKHVSVEMNIKAVDILERNGLACYSGLITGEDWKKEDFNTLINYLNSFKHPCVNVQPITPMPGTPLFNEYPHDFTIPRNKYEYWDMAHIVFKPVNMSKRRYYYHILRTYMKTSVSREGRRYIKEKYNKATYKRVRNGAFKIFCQYISLIINPK